MYKLGVVNFYEGTSGKESNSEDRGKLPQEIVVVRRQVGGEILCSRCVLVSFSSVDCFLRLSCKLL